MIFLQNRGRNMRKNTLPLKRQDRSKRDGNCAEVAKRSPPCL